MSDEILPQESEFTPEELRELEKAEHKRQLNDRRVKKYLARHPHYARYRGMLTRCYNTEDHGYPHYGARGIRVCDEWLESIGAFEAWVATQHYEKGMTLDRINVNGNYEPSNCRFVHNDIQQNNRQYHCRIIAFGETKTIADWTRDPRCVVSFQTLQRRVDRGWGTEIAITSPAEIRMGERSKASVLTQQQALEIYDLVVTHGKSPTAVANMFGVTNQTVCGITLGKTWKHLGLKPMRIRKRRGSA
jgi:hypothetical protein